MNSHFYSSKYKEDKTREEKLFTSPRNAGSLTHEAMHLHSAVEVCKKGKKTTIRRWKKLNGLKKYDGKKRIKVDKVCCESVKFYAYEGFTRLRQVAAIVGCKISRTVVHWDVNTGMPSPSENRHQTRQLLFNLETTVALNRV